MDLFIDKHRIIRTIKLHSIFYYLPYTWMKREQMATHFVTPKSVVLSIKVWRFTRWNGKQMSIGTMRNTRIIERKVRVNHFLFLLVFVILLRRGRFIAVVVVKVHSSLFLSFGDLDNNTFKGLISLLSVEQEIQYDEHT
jgi:hypothetical protein